MRNGFNTFKGTGVAIVTPFKKSGAIDYEGFEDLVNHVVSGGVDYIVLFGTTGESPTVTKHEKKALTDFALQVIDQRVPLVLGIGGNNTSEVVQTIQETAFKGIEAILSVSPYYSKPQQEGIYQHYKVIAETSPVPVILYTVPGRTGSNIAAATTVRLAYDFSNIAGIKEASGNFDQIFQVLKNRPKDFLVLSGDDNLTLPMIAAGADGVISVTANAYPREFSEMVRHALQGNLKSARTIHYKLLDFTSTLFADGSPSGIKAALEHKKLCHHYLRLPLVPVNNDVLQRIRLCIEQIEK